MGDVGREIVGGDVETRIRDLNRAAAAELNDAFRYRLLSKLAAGLGSRELADWFEATAFDEWHHLGMWMTRIISLGGQPFSRPAEADGLTYADYREPPSNSSNLRQMIVDSLAGERAAIRFYNELVQKTQHTDPVTYALAQQALVDEVDDEDDLEHFLPRYPIIEAEAHEPVGREARRGGPSATGGP